MYNSLWLLKFFQSSWMPCMPWFFQIYLCTLYETDKNEIKHTWNEFVEHWAAFGRIGLTSSSHPTLSVWADDSELCPELHSSSAGYIHHLSLKTRKSLLKENHVTIHIELTDMFISTCSTFRKKNTLPAWDKLIFLRLLHFGRTWTSPERLEQVTENEFTPFTG